MPYCAVLMCRLCSGCYQGWPALPEV